MIGLIKINKTMKSKSPTERLLATLSLIHIPRYVYSEVNSFENNRLYFIKELFIHTIYPYNDCAKVFDKAYSRLSNKTKFKNNWESLQENAYIISLKFLS